MTIQNGEPPQPGSSRGTEMSSSDLQRWNATLEQRVLERTAALQESEQSLADLFSRAPIGLLQVDGVGRIERVNRAQLDILALEREQVEGKPVYDFHLNPHEVQELLDSLAQGREIHNHRGRLRGGGGRMRHVLIDANGLWKQKALVHTRWFVRDITPRLELESAILAIAERERERVGHELHDDLCQRLTAIECMHDSLLNSWRPVKPAAAKLGKSITKRLHETLEHTRDLARGLSPSIHLGPDGLASALNDLADLSRRIFKRDCRFLDGNFGRIDDPAVSVHLFRIAQEAVINAVKHSKASRIEIELEENESNLTLAIRDNGVGLADPLPTGKGMGLKILQYRAAMINGSMAFKSQPNGGTAVICTVRKSGAQP